MSQFACGLCKENHPLRLCAEFRRMTPEIRLRTALIYRYCSNWRGQGARRRRNVRTIIERRSAALPWQQMLAVSPTVLIRIRTADRFTAVRAVLSPASPATTISAATVARLRLRTPVRGAGGVCYLTLRNNLGSHEEFSVCANTETISPTPTPLRSLSQQTVQAIKQHPLR
ncbi:PREDICTED: uncharacterized protein LOC108368269 [Rhagoletis zephyria]|uniref:uncharacterized protein LOC108368269 n=1 Tax=Rhagoletis zephyria TaxID=28612 RepID=UPI0008116C30|nr:PREDICTED: uncharacterized protein LOC108368269 [Rhagoletis zephyria]